MPLLPELERRGEIRVGWRQVHEHRGRHEQHGRGREARDARQGERRERDQDAGRKTELGARRQPHEHVFRVHQDGEGGRLHADAGEHQAKEHHAHRLAGPGERREQQRHAHHVGRGDEGLDADEELRRPRASDSGREPVAQIAGREEQRGGV